MDIALTYLPRMDQQASISPDPLAQRCLAGDRTAQREMYEQYGKPTFNAILRIVNNRHDAEDVLQEVFVEAFSKLGTYRHEAPLGAWIKRIAINRSLNQLRRRNPALLDPDAGAQVPEAPASKDDEELTRWNVERIKAALAQLADGYRVIFSLYYLEGYAHDEIAQILNITESTSKSQLNRARNKIKDMVSQSN